MAALLSASKGLLYVVLTSIALYLYITRWVRREDKDRDILRQRLSQLSKYANDIVLMYDDTGTIVEANDRAVEAYGLPLEQLIGRSVESLRAPGTANWRDDWKEIQEHGDMRSERIHLRADGTPFPVEISWRRIDDDGSWWVQSIIRDISERRKAEQQILRLKNIYAALSQTNQCIVRVSDQSALFKNICDIAIRFGHFRLAWIGIVDETTKKVVVEASAGPELAYLDDVLVSVDPGSAHSTGPSGQAILTCQPYIANNLPELMKNSPWNDRMHKYDLKASAAFPLHRQGKCIGALTLYSSDLGYFTQDLINLLKEMADDISFALGRLAADEEKFRLERELATSNVQINGIIEGSHNLILAVNSQMQLVLCNREQCALMQNSFGVEMQIGMDLASYATHPSPEVQRIIRGLKRATQGHQIEKEWSFVKNGEEFFYESYFAPLLDASRRSIGAFHIGRDVTEHRRMEANLRKLNVAVEQSPVTVVITNLDGNIEYVNPAFTATTGYSSEDVLGKNPRILKSGETSAEEYRAMWNAITSGKPWFGIFHNKRKDGALYWEEAVVAPVRDADGSIREYIAIKNDITARLEAEERATFLAFHDPLTHLPNRILAKTSIDHALEEAREYKCKAALLSIDVDNFKKINESLGFRVGDELLQSLAARMNSKLHTGDALCRLGGDEFLVVLSGVNDLLEIEERAAAVLHTVDEPFEIDGFELTVTLSIGVAVYPDNGAESDTLHRNSDLALYFAKKSGKNEYRFFGSQMESDANEYVTLLNGLRKALERKEFHLVYQPQMQLSSGVVVGAEALIRWEHPTLGSIRPDRFISIAENSGLIFEIGKWVIEEACRQAAEWKRLGLGDLRVAVNLSAVQLRRAGLPEIVAQALRDAQLKPSSLCLELTESALVENTANAIAILRRLKEMGIKLSLDDFGTEYSSFAYLRTFELDELKIDQSFIREIRTHPGAEHIVRSMIDVAKGFHLTTVAEGVEDEPTLDAVQRAGCDIVQGFYLARPMRSDAFFDYILSSQGIAHT